MGDLIVTDFSFSLLLLKLAPTVVVVHSVTLI